MSALSGIYESSPVGFTALALRNIVDVLQPPKRDGPRPQGHLHVHMQLKRLIPAAERSRILEAVLPEPSV